MSIDWQYEYEVERERRLTDKARIAALESSYALLVSEHERTEAELKLLSDKACKAVVGYRAALGKLTDSFKYSTEVVTIAREALAHSTEFTAETKVDQSTKGE